MCLAQLLSAITFNSMVRRQDQINLSCMQRKLGGQEINVAMRKQMSGLMKTENMTGRNGTKCERSVDTSSLICRDSAALPQGSERMLACSWELQVGWCCPFLWVLVLFVGSEPEEWGCQDWGAALSPWLPPSLSLRHLLLLCQTPPSAVQRGSSSQCFDKCFGHHVMENPTPQTPGMPKILTNHNTN